MKDNHNNHSVIINSGTIRSDNIWFRVGYGRETCAKLMQDCGFVYDSYNKKEEIETYFNTDVHMQSLQ